jgi:signal transduction histidine kinase
MLLKKTLGDITEEQKRGLMVILRNVNRLDNLIRDILDISRLESGTMKFITEITDIHKMIGEVAETMRSSADLKHVPINEEIEGKLPELIIDQERIKQVLINLVNNAIKFSPDGTVIIIKAKKEEENVLFEVQDFGRGIPKDKQKKIFETFYQVDYNMDRTFGGAGLGLAVSRGIVLAHGGSIWVRSKLGIGSTFGFTLPVKLVKDVENRFKEVDVFMIETDSEEKENNSRMGRYVNNEKMEREDE